MPTGRRSARRGAVFILYQQDLLALTADSAIGRSTSAALGEYVRRLVLGVDMHKGELDRLITDNITGWSLDRLGMLERAILRLATYELVWEREVPEAVVINEAVALAKRFCSAEAGALVNGVLGALATSERRPGPVGSAADDENGLV